VSCDERVCLSLDLCMFVSFSVGEPPELDVRCLYQIYVRVTHGRGLVILWRRCDTLCTSGL